CFRNRLCSRLLPHVHFALLARAPHQDAHPENCQHDSEQHRRQHKQWPFITRLFGFFRHQSLAVFFSCVCSSWPVSVFAIPSANPISASSIVVEAPYIPPHAKVLLMRNSPAFWCSGRV